MATPGQRRSFGRGGRRVTVPGGMDVGEERKLGRSGTVRTATRKQVNDFRRQQAQKRQNVPIPRETQRQIERAAEAVGDPTLKDRVSMTQAAETVERGRSGTLQRKTPDPEMFVGDRSVTQDVRESFRKVKGSDAFIPGDVGTQIVLSELRRRSSDRGLTEKQILGETQRLSKRAGLQGFKAKAESRFGPIVPLAIQAGIATLAAGALSAAGGTAGSPTTTTGAGQQQFLGVEPGTGAPAFGQAANLQFGSGVGASALSRGGLESAKASGALKSTGGFSALDAAKTALRAGRVASSLLGGNGGSRGPTGAQSTRQQPTILFQQPEVQTVRQPGTQTVAGATAAPFRNLRDKFGGTATASLFRPRRERFGTRTTGPRLGS